MPRPPYKLRRNINRQRGGVYLMVLGACMVVTIIGMSAIVGVHIQRRESEGTNHAVQSRLYAQSAVELALLRITEDSDWRLAYTHDDWGGVHQTLGTAILGGKWKLVDQVDEDLSDNRSDPVRVVAWGMAGRSIQKLSVELELDNFTFEARVNSSNDDAEEASVDGDMYRDGTDLELANDSDYLTDVVGMRFRNVNIPQAATIQNAYIQFKVDEVSTGSSDMTIYGQAADNPPHFSLSDYNITSRTRTTASVGWSSPTWTVVGKAGTNQRTPDLSPVIQEIIDRPGWAMGQAVAIIVDGSGRRAAESYDGESSGAPLLHVEWSTNPGSSPMKIVLGTWRQEVD